MYRGCSYVRLTRGHVLMDRCHWGIPVLTSRPPALPDYRRETPACGSCVGDLGGWRWRLGDLLAPRIAGSPGRNRFVDHVRSRRVPRRAGSGRLIGSATHRTGRRRRRRTVSIWSGFAGGLGIPAGPDRKRYVTGRVLAGADRPGRAALPARWRSRAALTRCPAGGEHVVVPQQSLAWCSR
jgi:hypothetical protein